MRTFRNVAFVLLCSTAVWANGVSASPRSGELCVQYSDPTCGNYYGWYGQQCDLWPQGGCYLLATQEILASEEDAQAACEEWVGPNGANCSWAVDAVRDGDCWWWCQFEMPSPAAEK
jgi:hypothetical protein